MILKIGWIPHAFSIASWWYQRVSYGIMIHSLTPVQWDRNQLEMALGLDLLRRMRKAEVGAAASWMSHWQVSYKLSSKNFTIDTYWGQYSFRW